MSEKKPATEENAQTGQWLRGPEEAAFAAVQARKEGLTAAEAAARLEEFGPEHLLGGWDGILLGLPFLFPRESLGADHR